MMNNLRLAAIAAAAFAMCAAHAATHYTVTELPHIPVDPNGDNEVDPGGLDDKGRAYITVMGSLDGEQRAFGEHCSDRAGCKRLPPKNMDSYWQTVSGNKAGGWVVDGDGVSWAARLTGGKELELLERNAVISGINKSGFAVGYKVVGPELPFVYDTELSWLPTLGEGKSARASAVNNKGLVVGEAEDSNRWCAVSWKNGVLKVLSCPPEGRVSAAYAVNSHGVVVGRSSDNTWGRLRAARYENGKSIDLGALGDAPELSGSRAVSINDAGVAVGWGTKPPTEVLPQAIVFDPTEGALELATLVPRADRDKYFFQFAIAISNAGQILARVRRRSDLRPAVVRLDPLPADR
jgi:probable HAF family extracellular repeat protein